jgi:hypothetical protein
LFGDVIRLSAQFGITILQSSAQKWKPALPEVTETYRQLTVKFGIGIAALKEKGE